MTSRTLSANLLIEPHGWRSPQFRPLVMGWKQNRHGRRVPNVRVETYPTEGMAAFRSAVIPVLYWVALDAATSYGIALEDESVLRGPIALRVRAIKTRPIGDHRIRSDVPRKRSTTKPDVTNIVKLVEDCCTDARWWDDDCKVSEQRNDSWLHAVPAHRCPKRKRDCREGERAMVQVLAWELDR